MTIKTNYARLELQKLNVKLLKAAKSKGLTKEDAEDCVQNTLYKCIVKFNENVLLIAIAQRNPEYFTNYVLKSLYNEIKNMYRSVKNKKSFLQKVRNKIETEFTAPGRKGEDPKNEKPIEPIQDPEQEIEILKREQRDEEESFIELLKSDLSELEIKFVKLYLEKAADVDNVIVEQIGRELGLEKTKAHDIFRIIKRKALNLQAKTEFGKRYFVEDWNKHIIVIAAKYIKAFSNKSATICTKNVMKKLAADEIETLYKIL